MSVVNRTAGRCNWTFCHHARSCSAGICWWPTLLPSIQTQSNVIDQHASVSFFVVCVRPYLECLTKRCFVQHREARMGVGEEYLNHFFENQGIRRHGSFLAHKWSCLQPWSRRSYGNIRRGCMRTALPFCYCCVGTKHNKLISWMGVEKRPELRVEREGRGRTSVLNVTLLVRQQWKCFLDDRRKVSRHRPTRRSISNIVGW